MEKTNYKLSNEMQNLCADFLPREIIFKILLPYLVINVAS